MRWGTPRRSQASSPRRAAPPRNSASPAQSSGRFALSRSRWHAQADLESRSAGARSGWEEVPFRKDALTGSGGGPCVRTDRTARPAYPRLEEGRMRKGLAIFGGMMLLASLGTPATAPSPKAQRPEKLLCSEGSPICAEAVDALGYEGEYTGHDEPSLLFYSGTPGAGNNSRYRVVVPQDPPILPKQDGTGGTFNFQDRIAFWFGMDLCDNQSAPEYTHDPCTPSSDSNIFDGADPNQPDYIGFHPGTAFLEVQFYPPGWVNWTEAISCDATQWCAAVAIFSFNRDQNNGVDNNADCLNTVGIEPANFAFITKSGAPHAPAAPLDQTLASFTPNPTTDLFMDAGDQINLSIHDSNAGLVVAINDVTSGGSGSMTASVANGFAQVNFDPTAATCSQTPYAFHPMYATSSEHTRVPWAAHSYNVAFSDEIGHFEYCGHANVHGKYVNPAPGDNHQKAADDPRCFNREASP